MSEIFPDWLLCILTLSIYLIMISLEKLDMGLFKMAFGLTRNAQLANFSCKVNKSVNALLTSKFACTLELYS